MFDRVAILTDEVLCLNHRYRHAGCQRCVSACPAQAIGLRAGLPVLDPQACVHCGACLAACPTGAFSQRVDPEALLVQRSQAFGRDRLAVACPLHPDPAASRAPVDRVLRHARCLASLDVDCLLALTHDGQRDLWLEDSACAACPIGLAHRQIVVTAEAANALLAGFGQPGRVHCAAAADAEAIAAGRAEEGKRVLRRRRLPVVQAAPESLARRELFARLRPPEADLAGQPKARRRLQHRLRAWSPPPDPTASVRAAAVPFADVRVDPARCTACGLCAALCPTAALCLRFHGLQREEKPKGGERWDLVFQPAACIDCGICAAACPEQAVRYGDALPVGHLDGRTTSVAAGTLALCASCGTPLAAQRPASRGLCYACRQGAGRVSPFQDTAGLLADLRQRMPPRTSQ
ncbi:MAG: 4Fe-4S dicluster domain-containing protein [Caldilineales bacterium]|nr:4Fe-4S dicluster domain-containing protein [Caldilineales bacterium]MDW8319141.1 4Fe-4S dicluster domain-containing protein [Anaerolineae bacterium]